MPVARVRPWAVVASAASAVLLLSLALPWVEKWNGRRTAGVSVLFLDDDYRPHLGVVLLVLWGVAVAGAVRGTRLWYRLAVPAAVGMVAICPVYYAAEFLGNRGLAMGRDPAGNIVEWVVRDQVMAGLFVAAAGIVLLCTGLFLRGRSLPAAG